MVADADKRRGAFRVRPSDIAWAALPVAVFVVLATWVALGLYDGSVVQAAGAFVAVAACVVVTLLWREKVQERFAHAAPASCAVRDIYILAAASCLTVLALELSWNAAGIPSSLPFALLELLMVALALGAAYYLAQRRGWLAALLVVAFALVGLAQYFVFMFKGSCILPSDVLALGTAAAVAGGFKYVLQARCLWALACMCAAVTALSFAGPVLGGDTARAAVGRTGLGVVLAGALVALVCCVDFGGAFGATFNYWWQMESYSEQGFLPSFVYCVQDLSVDPPQGYTEQGAQDARDSLQRVYAENRGASDGRTAACAQFDELKPNVVVVMNESFTDLSALGELGGAYAGPHFFNTELDAFCRGALAVPVYGGGTASTEYEFFTGNSLTFMGAGKQPYEMFDMTESSSVARQLAACGYGTLAVHPNLAANWNRDVAYQQLGFERFVDIGEFEGADVYNNGVADAETYRYVLEQLKKQDKPQFVFDLTMQNHGGYSTAAVPEQDVPGVHPAGLDSGVDDQLNGYLACIEASDRDLRAFVAELEKLDEPIVLLFFGDHHPSFSKQVNDALMPGEDDMTHEQRVHQTVYAMWANYDVAGFEGSLNDDTCSANLGAMLLDAIGAPLTPYQQAQLGARERVKSYDFYGYLCDDGAWRWFDDPGDYATDIHNLATICYQNFAGVSSR